MNGFVPHCGICGAAMPCMCRVSPLIAPIGPAPTPPEPPKTTIARFRKHGAYSVCELCNLAMDYCKGHALPEWGADAGERSDLAQRVREAQNRS